MRRCDWRAAGAQAAHQRWPRGETGLAQAQAVGREEKGSRAARRLAAHTEGEDAVDFPRREM